jgi:hypothetical protein
MVQRRARAAISTGVWVSALTVALAWSSTAVAQVTVTMRADRTQISVDEEFTLEIRVEASGIHSPDVQLPPLDAFEVLQRQVSRPMQFSFSFGSRSERVVRSSSIYTFVLRPQMQGRITIQPVKVKVDDRQYQSQPLTIIVGKGGAAPPAGAAPQDPNAPSEQTPEPAQPPNGILDGARFDPQAFVRTIVDKTDPYVGDQVTVSIYLYLRGALTSLPPVETEPTTDGFWIRDLLPPSRTLEATRQVVGGSIFKVYLLRRFAAFPLHSGNLTIGPLKIRIEQNAMPDIFDLFDMMDRGAAPTLRRSAIPLAIRVKELPEAGKPNSQVAVGRFEVSAKLDRNEVRTGDAVTLKAVVRGQGNIQTVQIELPKIDGLQILAPQVADAVESADSAVGGSRSYEWLVIPQKPGRFTIGPIGINAFNPATLRYQRVQAEALSLIAAGKGEERLDQLSAAQREPGSEQPAAIASFGPIRTTSEYARSRTRVATAPWYLALLALGPVAWFVLLATSWTRQTFRARAQKAGPQRAAREAKERLREATACAHKGDAKRCYAETAAAIQGVLEARLGAPVSGFTRPELRGYLASRDLPEPLIARTIEELERCDAARFSAAYSDQETMKNAVERVSDLLRQLSTFTPKRIDR